MVNKKQASKIEFMWIKKRVLFSSVQFLFHQNKLHFRKKQWWGDQKEHSSKLWSHMAVYSPEKWLHNRIYCPSNRSKQIQKTHTAYSAGTQYTRQSLNEKQRTWLHRHNIRGRVWMKNNIHGFTDRRVIGCEAMYVVFHLNFAAYIVCRR